MSASPMLQTIKKIRIPGREDATPGPNSVDRAELTEVIPTKRIKFVKRSRGEFGFLEADNRGFTRFDKGSYNRAFHPIIETTDIPR